MLQVFMLKSSGQLAEEGLNPVRGLLQMGGRAACRGCRIIELVRQARGHGPKGDKLFPLLRVAFQIAHLVGRGMKNLPRHRMTRAQQAPEILRGEPEQPGGLCHPGQSEPGNV